MRKVLWWMIAGVMAQPAVAKDKTPPPKPPAARGSEPAAEKDAITAKRLADALRLALAASRKANEDPDLASVLLGAIAQTSVSGVIHGHYALAGCGQALRGALLGADDVRAYARDMAQNWRQLSEVYSDLARQKAFDGELRTIFQALSLLSEKAGQTAALLGQWADLTSDEARAQRFEAALEDYRGRVKAFVSTLQAPPAR